MRQIIFLHKFANFFPITFVVNDFLWQICNFFLCDYFLLQNCKFFIASTKWFWDCLSRFSWKNIFSHFYFKNVRNSDVACSRQVGLCQVLVHKSILGGKIFIEKRNRTQIIIKNLNLIQFTFCNYLFVQIRHFLQPSDIVHSPKLRLTIYRN